VSAPTPSPASFDECPFPPATSWIRRATVYTCVLAFGVVFLPCGVVVRHSVARFCSVPPLDDWSPPLLVAGDAALGRPGRESC